MSLYEKYFFIAASGGSTASIFRLDAKQITIKKKAACTALQNSSTLMTVTVLSSETSVKYLATCCGIALFIFTL